MRTRYRTHTCGALRAADEGSEVTLCGWAGVVRDQGGVLFVDLRDRHGVTQVTFRGDKDAELLARAERVRGEWVLQVTGRVIRRPPEASNPTMPTGEIELEATALTVLSEAETPPFPLDERSDVSPEVRLKHRFLDLRRRPLTDALTARARISSSMRAHLEANGFVDIETPTLIRSTPEGARDYLVPSRVHPGAFYALPQSPQLFKQLLMIGGQDRYYQFAHCYRDEDLRADRQPEFTQVDIEASFVGEEDLFGIMEPMVAALIEEWRGESMPRPFLRLPYAEALARFGSDKPDLRNPLELTDVTAEGAALGFAPFQSAADAGGLVKALLGPGAASFSRKEIEGMETAAKGMGAPGLAWAKVAADGPTGPLARFLGDDAGRAFLESVGAKPGDWLCCAAGDEALVNRILGNLRETVARKLDLVDLSKNAVLWVTEFPLVAWNEEEGRFDAQHHPFTSPTDETAQVLLRAAAGEMIPPEQIAGLPSRAYDLVLNGSEVAGGSIRIHRADVQRAVFDLLNIGPDEVEQRFGWFVDALKYGTPPHGGLAFGFDRFVMTLLGATAIQDVIAFPKTMAATDLLCRAPSTVDPQQLDDLRIRLDPGTDRAGRTSE
jgi:aspartyl-tRNA synthetase